MGFIADRQTLEDLKIPGKFRHQSIFSLFNHVKTAGGEKRLEELFRTPLTDATAINIRSLEFQYVQQQGLPFPLDPDIVQQAEVFLRSGGGSGLAGTAMQLCWKKWTATLFRDPEYDSRKKALVATLQLLHTIAAFLDRLAAGPDPNPLTQKTRPVLELLQGRKLRRLTVPSKDLSFVQMIRYQHLLLQVLQRDMARVLELIAELDVWTAVAELAKERGFHYALALPAEKQLLHIRDLTHPWLKKGTGNTIRLDAQSNMLFLTGANMAGKSTLMKSFGIAVYLAHMGFPVAVSGMEFSVKDGLFSSINVSDDLSQGYSHFYAEVLRVKGVAEAVSRGSNLVILFDELFKGTNVRDAYDATLAVTRAFARHRNCNYIISTHIIEAGEALREEEQGIQFRYLPTIMEENRPVYTYQLKEGITADRHGMRIIENERIIELILQKESITI